MSLLSVAVREPQSGVLRTQSRAVRVGKRSLASPSSPFRESNETGPRKTGGPDDAAAVLRLLSEPVFDPSPVPVPSSPGLSSPSSSLSSPGLQSSFPLPLPPPPLPRSSQSEPASGGLSVSNPSLPPRVRATGSGAGSLPVEPPTMASGKLGSSSLAEIVKGVGGCAVAGFSTAWLRFDTPTVRSSSGPTGRSPASAV